MHTVESAPTDRRILVWVREAQIKGRDGKRRGQWVPGRALHAPGLPKSLHADAYSGDWDIPFWTDFPPDAE